MSLTEYMMYIRFVYYQQSSWLARTDTDRDSSSFPYPAFSSFLLPKWQFRRYYAVLSVFP